MADPSGFLKHQRKSAGYRPVTTRIFDYCDVAVPLTPDELNIQASRCMGCGIPFCHSRGCPIANAIPEINDLVHRQRWRDAAHLLHSTNNFPEITGRVCPALCEAACTLSINSEPVTIKHIELQVAERAFEKGWVKPLPPPVQSGARVAVVGSGPAGLAAAQQLRRVGHEVVVFEKGRRVGGLLRYGIPDFKLEKQIIDRRVDQLIREGVVFETEVNVGHDLSASYLRRRFDAICLSIGASKPRELPVQGRGFDGIHFACDFLVGQNLQISGESVPEEKRISARDKIVVVIGGGDTGSDCVGTAVRQGAREVHQLEILPAPPERNNPETPWPMWPKIRRRTSSHEEGCQQRWGVQTTHFSGMGTRVSKLHGVEVEWVRTRRGLMPKKISGTEFSMPVDLVLLALGFWHVEHRGLVKQLELGCGPQGNLQIDDFQTTIPGIFATGDAVNGASLIVNAIYSGRQAALAIDRWLTK